MVQHTLNYANPPRYKDYCKRNRVRFGYDIKITEKEFLKISAMPCHYCGVSGPNGIDRKYSTKAYQKGNCVPCCKHCNYVKGNLSAKDFKTWSFRFVTHQTLKGK